MAIRSSDFGVPAAAGVPIHTGTVHLHNNGHPCDKPWEGGDEQYWERSWQGQVQFQLNLKQHRVGERFATCNSLSVTEQARRSGFGHISHTIQTRQIYVIYIVAVLLVIKPITGIGLGCAA